MIYRQINTQHLYCLGTTDWLVTNLRLAARAAGGLVISIYWAAVCGLSADLVTEVVVLDGVDGYHGELSGPAIAPIAVTAIASRFGLNALLDHPALTTLRS